MNNDETMPDVSTIHFGNSHIAISLANVSHRYLGIWISGNNSPSLVYSKLRQEILNINGAFHNKPVTDKIAAYITNAVTLPVIEYRTKGTFLTSNHSTQLTNDIKRTLRKKFNLSRETAAKTIHHPDFYNIPTVTDILITARTSELLYDLNSPNIEGLFTRHRLKQMQYHTWTRLTPLAIPTPSRGYRRFPLLSGIVNALSVTGCSILDCESSKWQRPTPQRNFFDLKLTIEDALGPFGNYRQAARNLKPYGLMYMDQITAPGDDKKLRPYSVIKKAAGHNPKGRKPLWYKLLERKVAYKPEAPFDIPDTQNNHARKWTTSAEA